MPKVVAYVDGIKTLIEASNVIVPEIPTEATAPAITYKTDIWQRCTDEEAEILDGQLSAASVKDRRMWDDCTAIYHDSPMFSTLRAAMTGAFGAARAAHILAPSIVA